MIAAAIARSPMRGYLRIARLDHWVKNLFVLPGAAVALATGQSSPSWTGWLEFAAGLLALWLVSSSNYVLNEILDAPYDRHHPLRCSRPVPCGQVDLRWAWAEWLILFAAALAVAAAAGTAALWCVAALWLSGLLYNAPPVRLKDFALLDVLAEAANNPIRFAAGWYLTGALTPPFTSLLLSYWLVGCYLMAIKRLSEFREIPTVDERVRYRRCFRFYTERRLLVFALFCGSLSLLFLGAFMGRYRLEMVVSFPFVAALMSAWLALAFKPNSAAQLPERLLSEKYLMAAVFLCGTVMLAMLVIDLPWLAEWFAPTPVRKAH